ncbi:MAG: polyprenol monophosphomannose synthase [Candidatus Eremiobacteraeota bacterium]|nr:polyprenol monophosphomannose synthase [Candidatus Eremiobacteraeota bacterium]
MTSPTASGQPANSRCLVVLPTYRERENIEATVRAVLDSSARVDAVVVDDSSPDGTADLVNALRLHEPRLFLISRPGKLGLGTAYVAGIRFGLDAGYDIIATMDADGSHDPSALPAMLAQLDADGADVVIGSRYVAGGSVENFSLARKANSAVANAVARALLGLRVRDCTSGFRAYDATLLRAMRLDALRSTGYSMVPELLYEATRSGARIAEVPIAFRNREKGVSKVTVGEILSWMRTVAALRR